MKFLRVALASGKEAVGTPAAAPAATGTSTVLARGTTYRPSPPVKLAVTGNPVIFPALWWELDTMTAK